jgi:hypothetical protein
MPWNTKSGVSSPLNFLANLMAALCAYQLRSRKPTAAVRGLCAFSRSPGKRVRRRRCAATSRRARRQHSRSLARHCTR